MSLAIPVRPYGSNPSAQAEIGSVRQWLLALTAHLVERRSRRAVKELRRHQAFGPLIRVKHVDLALGELLPFIRED